MEFTPDLLDDFLSKKVAIFLGAGVSAGVNTRDGQHVKTWSAFLGEQAAATSDPEIIKEVTDLLGKSDYLFACEILKNHYRDEWEDLLKREYEKIGTLTALQTNILKLKQRIIVTTNFDLFIEHYWEQVYDSETHYLQVKNGISSDCFSAFRDNKNYLFKLHGSISIPETIIFSLSDYASKAYSNWQYNTFMEILLSTHTVLFIGFSMNDVAITNMLEIYAKKYPKNRPHYAFLSDYYSPRKIQIMKSHRKLFVIPYSSANNHSELVELIKLLNSQIMCRKKLVLSDVAT